ncbi:MAG: DHH family phosphoesterase, partial [Halobacteriaceae archaeon]
MQRLLLGCGTFGNALLDAADNLGGKTHVLDPDRGRVEALRNEKIAAEYADITDPAAIEGYDADLIVVASDDAGVNQAAILAATDAYPDAYHICYHGDDASEEHRSVMNQLADRTISPGRLFLNHIEEMSEGNIDRMRELRRAINEIDGTLGVFMHDNPDPDAIASAIALVQIAEALGTEAEACYFGTISHQENQAFVNLLDIDLRQLDAEEEVDFEGIALVDHSRPGVNDQLNADVDVDIVIDHHPTAQPVSGAFVDLRASAGATSTLMAGYVRQLEIAIDSKVATSLLYGIRVDTKDFTREVSHADFEAAAYLLEDADTA